SPRCARAWRLEGSPAFWDNPSLRCRGVAQPGSAPDWGSGGRWFESSHPDQIPRFAWSLLGWRLQASPDADDASGRGSNPVIPTNFSPPMSFSTQITDRYFED